MARQSKCAKIITHMSSLPQEIHKNNSYIAYLKIIVEIYHIINYLEVSTSLRLKSVPISLKSSSMILIGLFIIEFYISLPNSFSVAYKVILEVSFLNFFFSEAFTGFSSVLDYKNLFIILASLLTTKSD